MIIPLFDLVRRRTVLFDGAIGTELMARGLGRGIPPELWNAENPDVVREVYAAYFEAGADVVSTNSFGGTPIRLAAHGLENRAFALNRAAARLAREAAPSGRYVAGSMGPTGKFLEPQGPATEAELAASYAEQARALVEGGVDVLIIETQYDLREALAALRGVQSVSPLPVFVTMTFGVYPRGYFTIMGDPAARAAAELEQAGAAAVGANCTLTSEQMVGCVRVLRAATHAARHRPGQCRPAGPTSGRHVRLFPERRRIRPARPGHRCRRGRFRRRLLRDEPVPYPGHGPGHPPGGAGMTKNEIYTKMSEAIVAGDRQAARALAEEAVRSGFDLLEVVEQGYVPGIQRVGALWEQGEYFLPELITSAEAMKSAMAVLNPELNRREGVNRAGARVVIGTVEGDIHDIGKNLVASMLQAGGFEVTDLGVDVKLERFIEAADAAGAGLICLSALLTTTMTNQRRFLELLKERGLRDKYKVLVGGAPASRKWAEEIGADGFAENAVAAVKAAKALAGLA